MMLLRVAHITPCQYHIHMKYHCQLSFAYIVPGMSYPMATLPHAYTVHTDNILCTLCCTTNKPKSIMFHAHFFHYALCPLPFISNVFCAPYPISHMPTMSDAHYALCNLCPMPIFPHTYYVPCLL